MKARRIIALYAAMVMVFALCGTAAALPSPIGSSIVGASANVEKVEIKSISATKEQALVQTANDYIAAVYGAKYKADTLLSINLVVTRKDNAPATISLNVAGVKLGDIILVVHERADGTMEIVPGKVLANGVVEFTLARFSPVSFIRVASKDASSAQTLPKTGADAAAAPGALLLTASLVCLAFSIKPRKVMK
ncbi:MAG: hypothetical protein VB049_12270 [Candidatus Pelethousia sp.]|nr:hypothetical protein [Candidatus Pelethousia sp.]